MSEVSTITIKILCNTGANCFITNNKKYSHDLSQCNDSVDVTGSSVARVSFKGVLYLILTNKDKENVIVKVTCVPCMKSNLHNGLPLSPFLDYGFTFAACVACNCIMLKDSNDSKYVFHITTQRNGLDFTNFNLIKPLSDIPKSFNMIQVNLAIKAHKKFLHAFHNILHKTSASGEIINIPCVSSTKIDCPICLVTNITQSTLSSSKIKKT